MIVGSARVGSKGNYCRLGSAVLRTKIFGVFVAARNENIFGSALLASQRKYFGRSARLGTKIFWARLGSARNENIFGSARLGSERKYFGRFSGTGNGRIPRPYCPTRKGRTELKIALSEGKF